MSKNSLLLSDEDLTNISGQTNIDSDVIKSWHKGINNNVKIRKN
jgi:hypothetical protein